MSSQMQSSSVIVTSPVVVVPRTIPLEGFESVNVPVSLPSTSPSSLILTVNEPVVSPSAMVMLVGMNPVKSSAVAVPERFTSTVCSPTTGLDAVAVTVIVGLPVSFIVTGETERLTVGESSLSVISTSPVVVVPKTIPLEGLEIVNVPVSLPSTSSSSLILTVNEPVVSPSAMVMQIGISPVKSSAVAVSEKLTSTV